MGHKARLVEQSLKGAQISEVYFFGLRLARLTVSVNLEPATTFVAQSTLLGNAGACGLRAGPVFPPQVSSPVSRVHAAVSVFESALSLSVQVSADFTFLRLSKYSPVVVCLLQVAELPVIVQELASSQPPCPVLPGFPAHTEATVTLFPRPVNV